MTCMHRFLYPLLLYIIIVIFPPFFFFLSITHTHVSSIRFRLVARGVGNAHGSVYYYIIYNIYLYVYYYTFSRFRVSPPTGATANNAAAQRLRVGRSASRIRIN